MISVGSRDARKRLELGFDDIGHGGGRDMEDTELEEGEACSNQNNENYDAVVDPDVALSYIDVKIQDVLGHFQKDFETEVSLETLGRKFGGYGSFLSAQQRSPPWSQPKTPPKIQSCNIPKSPNLIELEGCRGNPAVYSTVSQTARHGPSSGSSMGMPATKALSINNSNGEVCNQTTQPGPFSFNHESLSKKAKGMMDQKPLKVRIKMSRGNLNTKKNAAIYSGLGLDVSPSLSNDSQSGSEGISHKLGDGPFESPTSILQIMTSFPPLLSPLADDLVLFAGKGTSTRDKTVPAPRNNLENSDAYVRDSDFVEGDRKLSVKKMKLRQGICDGVITKGPESRMPNCEEIISKTLKLPFVSNVSDDNNDSSKGTGRPFDNNFNGVSKGTVSDKEFSDLITEKRSCVEDSELLEKSKDDAVEKGVNSNNEPVDHLSMYKLKENQKKRERSCSSKIEFKGRKAQKAESAELPKKTHKISTHELDNLSSPIITMENQYSGEKKKSKETHVHGGLASDIPENLKVASSLLLKSNRNSDEGSFSSKNDIADVKVLTDHGRSKDRYREMIGDLEGDQARMNLSNSYCENKPRDPEVVGKSIAATDDAQKSKVSSKKPDRSSSSTRYAQTETVLPYPAHGPVKDGDAGKGVLGTVAAAVVEDNWVQCDRCQKWRLLPVGKNPESLPDKWLCSMLDWLPSMNSCSIGEEETRKAVLALYQVPVLEGQNNLLSIDDNIMKGGTVSSVQHPDPYSKDRSLQEMPVGKKKPGGELLNAANKDGSENLSISKNNLQPSVRSGSLTDTNRSPPNSGSSFHKQRMSSDLAGDKHKHKQKSRGKLLGEDEAKSLKVKHGMDPNQDACGANKKSKMEKMNTCDAEHNSCHSGALLKVNQSSSNNFRTASSSKDQLKHKDSSSSKDSKHNTKERRQLAVKKQRNQNQCAWNDQSFDIGNSYSKDSIRKRNFADHQDTHTFIGSIQNTDHPQENGVSVQEIFSENNCRRVKKARSSNPENKESSTSKGNDRTGKKEIREINKELKQDFESIHLQQAVDGTDCVKRDSASIQDPAAATSSSSKVSGSRRTKISFQEVKGSPVESVSSSPIRISNLDKLALSKKEQIRKAEPNGGLRQCYGEDDGGSDRSATIGKPKNSKSSTADFRKKDPSRLSGTKSKGQVVASQIVGDGVNDVGQHAPPLSKAQTLGKFEVEEGPESSNYSDAPHSRKLGKGSSSRSKEKNRNFRPDSIAEKINNSEQLQDCSPSHEPKYRDAKTRSQDMIGVKSDGNENKTSRKKFSSWKLLDDGNDREKESNDNEHEYCNVRRDATSTNIQNLLVDSDGEKSSKSLLSEKSEQVDQVPGRGKFVPLPSSGGVQNEAPSHCPQPVSDRNRVDGDVASKVDDESKPHKKLSRKADNQNGTKLVNSTKSTSNEHGTKELDAPCAVRRDSSTHAANNALKEAKDLKHLADRLKNSGSSESTGYYFEAALKFLHGASLLESSNNGNAKYNEIVQSKQVYSSTAKLCEFCAHEYERAKDMGAAALAYKCMEVAYMRVIYSSHVSASRDRQELQTALQVVPLGESPSSSASDVDNVNNSVAADKVAIPKDGSSPQLSGTHIISACNRPSVLRLLNFTQDVNFAMEASRRSRNAFATINAISVNTKNAESISSIKKALDFNFLDVEGLLKLVRLAMEVINC